MHGRGGMDYYIVEHAIRDLLLACFGLLAFVQHRPQLLVEWYYIFDDLRQEGGIMSLLDHIVSAELLPRPTNRV